MSAIASDGTRGSKRVDHADALGYRARDPDETPNIDPE